MKLGYKIIILIFIIVGLILYFSNGQRQEELRFKRKIEKIVTNIRHRDYFSFQQELLPKLTKSISIESINKFMDPLKIERNSKIELKAIEEKNNTYHISGNVDSNKLKIPFDIYFVEDNNSTIFLINSKIGNSTLEGEGSVFPLKAITVPVNK